MWNIFVAALIPATTAVWLIHPEFFGEYSGLEWSWSYANTTEAYLRNWRSFNWHPFMMTIAFGFFSTIALPTYALMPCERKRPMKITHAIFQFLALCCGIFGVWVAFQLKEHTNKEEMTTVHSWIGFGAIVFYAIQVSLGLFFFLFLRVCCRDESRFIRKSILHMHRFLGFCFYVNVILAMITGIYGRQWIYYLQQNPEVDLYGANYVQANILVFLILIAFFTVTYIIQHCLPVQKQRREA